MGAGYSKGRKRTVPACEMAVLQQPEQQEAKRIHLVYCPKEKPRPGLSHLSHFTNPAPSFPTSHLSQISFCSLVKGFTGLICSLESSLLAYSTRRKIHSFPSAVTPWMCFSLKAAASAVSPRTGRVFNVWSNLQGKTATMLLSEEPNGLLLLSKIIPSSKAFSSQSSGPSLQPKLTVPSFQPTRVARTVVQSSWSW